ncbi:MAG: PEP-CTERM sorting domain-containing protein [Akkermansiaceae bacterium]|nr:PEP-CTERM sorting domain-containing protein [Akkermansiaceae bacterium]
MRNSALTVSLVALLAGGVQAASVAINFQRSPNGEQPMSPGDVAGVIAQSNWNNVTGGAANAGSIADLVTDAGANSGVSVEWAGDTSWSNNNGTANGHNKMMGGYLDHTGTVGAKATFTNISYDTYDIYVYFGSDGNGRTGQVTDGTTSFSYTTNSATGGDFPNQYTLTTDTTGSNPAANYAVFSDLSGATQVIDIIRGSSNSGIHGIQIVDTSVVPEPGSLALLIPGIGMMFLRRRR